MSTTTQQQFKSLLQRQLIRLAFGDGNCCVVISDLPPDCQGIGLLFNEFVAAAGAFVATQKNPLLCFRHFPQDLTESYAFSLLEVPSITDDDALALQLHGYIMEHLTSPFPSLKQLAHIFGTNEFRIKSSFKHAYGDSVYHFYNRKRLLLASTLITATNNPLKEIADCCCFKDYPNFSKAFKKEFGISPNEFARSAKGSAAL